MLLRQAHFRGPLGVTFTDALSCQAPFNQPLVPHNSWRLATYFWWCCCCCWSESRFQKFYGQLFFCTWSCTPLGETCWRFSGAMLHAVLLLTQASFPHSTVYCTADNNCWPDLCTCAGRKTRSLKVVSDILDLLFLSSCIISKQWWKCIRAQAGFWSATEFEFEFFRQPSCTIRHGRCKSVYPARFPFPFHQAGIFFPSAQ